MPTTLPGLMRTNSSLDQTADIWRDKNICHYLNASTDTQIIITCKLDLYLPPFIYLLGLVSNIFVIAVLCSKHFQCQSTAFYMTVNAVTDFLSILVALPAHYIFVNFPDVFQNARQEHAICSFFNTFGWGTSDLGVLFTVAMTTERAIAVKYPLRASKLCTTQRAKYVVIGLTMFELAKVSHLIFKSRIVSNTTSRLCDIDKSDSSYAHFYDNIWPWLHFSILILSYTLVILGNSIIILNICNSSSSRGTTAAGGRRTIRRDSQVNAKNRQLSVMLVIDSFTLVLCTLPFAIVNILMIHFSLLLDSTGGKNLPFTVTFYLLYVNRSLNFFLYCVSGSRFRAALRDIFQVGKSKDNGTALSVRRMSENAARMKDQRGSLGSQAVTPESTMTCPVTSTGCSRASLSAIADVQNVEINKGLEHRYRDADNNHLAGSQTLNASSRELHRTVNHSSSKTSSAAASPSPSSSATAIWMLTKYAHVDEVGSIPSGTCNPAVTLTLSSNSELGSAQAVKTSPEAGRIDLIACSALSETCHSPYVKQNPELKHPLQATHV